MSLRTFAIVRTVLAVYIFVLLLWSIISDALGDNGPWWPIYLTHWTLAAQWAYLWASCFITWIDYRHDGTGFLFSDARRSRRAEQRVPPWTIRTAWYLRDLVATGSMLVAILFWTLVYSGGALRETTVQTHGINWLIMLFEVFISKAPLRMEHVYVPMLYGLLYVLWSVVHALARVDNGDKEGTAAYSTLDFTNAPGAASVTAILVLLLVLPLFHFAMVKWRDLGARCLGAGVDDKSGSVKGNGDDIKIDVIAPSSDANDEPI